MPESQDDDEQGYFPLVMTRKSKGQTLSLGSPTVQNATNGGVNGS